MGLPVHQIISALEGQMREVEEDGDEGVQGGLEDEDEEDATEEDLIPDLSFESPMVIVMLNVDD